MPLFCFLLVLGSLHAHRDWVAFQWLMGSVGCSLFIANEVRKRVALLPALALAYILLEGLYVFMYKDNRFIDFPVREQIKIIHSSAYSLVTLGFLVALFFLTSKKTLAHFLRALPFLTLLNAFIVCGGFLFHSLALLCLYLEVPAIPNPFPGRLPAGHGYVGLLDYAGMNGVLIVLGLPSLFWLWPKGRVRTWSLVLVLASVLLSKSTAPWLVLASEALAVTGVRATLVSIVVIAIGWVYEGRHFWNSSKRIEYWQIILRGWWEHARSFWDVLAFGTGLGTFQVVGPMIQKENNFMNRWPWIWAHSDCVELLFMFGVVGVLLFAALSIDVLLRLKKIEGPVGKVLFSTAIGYGVSTIFDFPKSYFLTAALGVFLVAAAYRLQEDEA